MNKKNIVIVIVLIFIISIALDLFRISHYKTYLIKPKHKIETNESKLYWHLANGDTVINWNELNGILEFISNEYDCADFRLVNLIRILYEYNDKIPVNYKKKIENVLLHFRYWIDEPGENSMCYWSENHQILFASAEYLVGQMYKDKIFFNSGITGLEHMLKAKKRILDWLEMRWKYGFTEFYSNVYYKEDIAALVNLIDFANDEEIVRKSKIIMDLIFYDVATQSYKDMFVSASGRAYESSRKGPRTLSGLTSFWGNGQKLGPSIIYGIIKSKKYQLPPVLKKIAKDSSNIIIKQCNGLDISDLPKEGYYGIDMRSIMMQWGMETFINPEVVRNSLAIIRAYSMFSNKYFSDMKYLDFTLFRIFHLEPLIIKCINPPYLGTAIQRANTYLYKTKDYSMYTVQSYHAGEYADQQHIFGMNIKNYFAIFHTHPAVDRNIKNFSPNYWVGYGRLPYSVQDINVNISIYNIPQKKSFMEKQLLHFTHAYFPKDKFDTIVIDKNYLFGKKDDTYCAFIGSNNFYFRDGSNNDVILEGAKAYWITEAGCKRDDGDFKTFINRIKGNKIVFNVDDLYLKYESNNKIYEVKYNQYFKINGKNINTNYKRFESPYVQLNNNGSIKIFKGEDTLYLDFNNMIRRY